MSVSSAQRTVLKRADEVLEQVEPFQGLVVQTMRKFVNGLDDRVPNLVSDPATRRQVVIAIGDFYEQLAVINSRFVARALRSAIGTLTK